MTFHKYTKIWALGKEEVSDIFTNKDDVIIIQEKIDGANFRFMTKDGEIIFGSRNLPLEKNKQGGYSKNFNRCCKHILEKTKDCKLEAFNNLIFYGECCVSHTISYDWDNIPAFLGFDVYDLDEGKFVNYKQMKDYFELLELETVPLWQVTTAGEIEKVDDDDVSTSAYAPLRDISMKAEGMVFKNYTKQLFGKYVRAQFKEENAMTFGDSPKWATNDNDKLVLKYCTNQRIEKTILKLRDEDNKLEMSMMSVLPMRVWNDIWEENLKDIIRQRWIIDMYKCKKSATNRCLRVLNQIITNSQFDEHEEGTCVFCGAGLQDWDHVNSCTKCE